MKSVELLKPIKTLWSAAKIIVAVILFFAVSLSSAVAVDAINWEHVPPVIEQGSFKNSLPIKLGGLGLKRARVLVGTRSGYKALDLAKVDESFEGSLRFDDLAVITYQFQVETNDGNLHESSYYTIRQPSSDEMESQLVALRKEAEALEAKELQLQNALQGLKTADPMELAKRKNSELARAYVRLGRSERNLVEAEREILSKEQIFLKEMQTNDRARSVEEARRFLVEDAEKYWGK